MEREKGRALSTVKHPQTPRVRNQKRLNMDPGVCIPNALIVDSTRPRRKHPAYVIIANTQSLKSEGIHERGQTSFGDVRASNEAFVRIWVDVESVLTRVLEDMPRSVCVLF